MALYVKQNDSRSELQQRLAAELQEKARQKAAEPERPDGVDDSQFVKNTKSTGGLAGVWIAIIAFAAIGAVWLVIVTAG
ncbi:MAG TPA: hypothetical protein QF549_00930 [Candidatus Saccharimonadaceae bacterium]|nr:hypothetical protein [Candidatus Saccharimonadaceae bacterium]|tara:strand:+ start:1205 stop:1441 length:237 start_codon:yes stop_codon:yes gene_type:complete